MEKWLQKGKQLVLLLLSLLVNLVHITLRTFHVGGTASNIAVDANIKAKFDGIA